MTGGGREVVVLADPEELAREAARRFAAAAVAAVARAGRFVVALAGGSTPRRAYEALAAEPYRSRVPWERTHVFWGDERAVSPDHPDSNYGMARAALLARVPIPPRQVHRMAGSLFPSTPPLRETRRWVVRGRGPQPHTDRLTFTLPLLNAARAILFLAAGDEKAAALEAILLGPPDPEGLPARRVRPAAGTVVWLADAAAARRLAREHAGR